MGNKSDKIGSSGYDSLDMYEGCSDRLTEGHRLSNSITDKSSVRISDGNKLSDNITDKSSVSISDGNKLSDNITDKSSVSISDGHGMSAYRILLRQDYFGLVEEMKALGMDGRRFMIVSDSNVAGLYLKECLDMLRPVAKYAGNFVFEAGELSKNLATVSLCYKRLLEAGFDRNDVLIALGGGVTGDLTGFTAATYQRGIRFVQLPTSLLAMVDSSIGGKTGVDYEGYKNMVGAFYQPKLVYINLSVIKTLPDNQFISGMAEVIKHGLIKDNAYYSWLKANKESIQCRDYSVLTEMIYKSCLIKKEVVERDPKEAGERALLNFGHTIGHSIEKLKGFRLLHGECVSIGIAAASYISCSRGYLDKTDLEEILKVLADFGAPISTDGLSSQEVYETTRLDKKMDGDRIKFILLRGIGNAVIDASVSSEELQNAIGYVMKSN